MKLDVPEGAFWGYNIIYIFVRKSEVVLVAVQQASLANSGYKLQKFRLPWYRQRDIFGINLAS